MREMFDRIARLRTKSAKSWSWSKCAKFRDRANPYYPPMFLSLSPDTALFHGSHFTGPLMVKARYTQ